MNILKKISGSILIIGPFDEKNFSKSITEVFYLSSVNHNNKSIDNNSLNITKNMHLKNLHKYFKTGIDNIYADFSEIKNHIPAFIHESLRISNDIYIYFKYKKDYEFLLKKFKRFNLDIIRYESNNHLLMLIKVKKVSKLSLFYYYILDSIQNFYNIISDNM